ncbi:MAG: tRNA 2-thiouridine(34) synthase MnmA [Bacilli bacterium]|nr:tRNA 2-thiouridine(34) synthase MnmA [Bacilli bacterium]
MKRVLLGMSGGVDSSTAIIFLQKQGYEVVGITFRFLEEFDDSDAKAVAEKLSIEHHTVDYREEFKRDVIDKFLNDYSKGLTPNPCVICNRKCKFKFLFENMDKYNCDYIATGHYAKIENGKLYRSKDLNKDQSYFLYDLPKEKIDKIIFPLEGMSKDKVREIANEYGLVNANKKDSFDVCFIKGTFNDYISENAKSISGDVVDIDTNEIIGKHKGLMYYTIGQRRGLDIGGTSDRMFVVGKDIEKNILYICIGDDNDYLISDSCLIENVNYLGDEKVTNCTAKFRYRMEDVPVELEYLDDNKMLVKYSGIKRVTPGQACVLYDKDQCLGGGIITEVRKNNQKLWYI